MQNAFTLVILGYGNMAKGILSGLLKSDIFKNNCALKIKNIQITGRNPSKINDFLEIFFDENTHLKNLKDIISLKSSNEINIEDSILLLACKPSNLNNFKFNGVSSVTISILAGVNSNTILKHAKSKFIALVMPNVGAFYALSSNAVLFEECKENMQKDSKNTLLKDEALNYAKIFIESFGNCIFVDNFNQLNASIATNGSSPAVLALIAQGLINAGIFEGLNLTQSQMLVQQTFKGIAHLLKYKSPQEIKDLVTSPGGTTARALLHCDEKAVQGNITKAMIKAVKKARNIKNNYK